LLPIRSNDRLHVVRAEIHVRANAAYSSVGGEFDGALVVRVVEPAESGRATEAALGAVAECLQVPRRSVALLRGSRSRRKLIEIRVSSADELRVEAALARLRTGGER